MRQILALLLAAPALLYGQSGQEFQIKGVVRGLPDNTVIELREQDPQVATPVATSIPSPTPERRRDASSSSSPAS
jgi:hypothetical protein